MTSQPKSSTKKKKEESSQTPNTPKSPFTWYRALAGVVVLLATFASPKVTNSFYGKAVIGGAKCIAFEQTKNMGQCLSNVFRGRAASANVPVTGTVPEETAGNLPQEGFHEQGQPQKQYDAHGARVFPEADKHREEADSQAKLRGAKFEESQMAFKAGHKNNANQLSAEGKRHGQLMEEANKKAVQAILRPQRSSETGVLDLHGLHVKEAEEAAEVFLVQQRQAKRFAEVEIVTGAGHHSNGGVAKIKPAIERLISRLDFPYHHPADNNGAFVVALITDQDRVDQM